MLNCYISQSFTIPGVRTAQRKSKYTCTETLGPESIDFDKCQPPFQNAGHGNSLAIQGFWPHHRVQSSKRNMAKSSSLIAWLAINSSFPLDGAVALSKCWLQATGMDLFILFVESLHPCAAFANLGKCQKSKHGISACCPGCTSSLQSPTALSIARSSENSCRS